VALLRLKEETVMATDRTNPSDFSKDNWKSLDSAFHLSIDKLPDALDSAESTQIIPGMGNHDYRELCSGEKRDTNGKRIWREA
jgi:hypothetical protein